MCHYVAHLMVFAVGDMSAACTTCMDHLLTSATSLWIGNELLPTHGKIQVNVD